MSLGQSLGQKIASNTLISVVGRIASGALGLIAVALISRYLGREGFGEYSIILIFLYIVLAVSDLGLYSILSREISKIENNENKIISSIFGLRILSALLFFVVSFVVLYFLPYSKDIKIGILVASPGFLFLSANQLLMGVFQKHFKTIWPMIGDIIMRGAQLVFVFLFINFKMSLLFFALAISFGALFGFFANMIFARKLVKFSFIFDFNLSKEILKKSWPLAVSSVLTLVYFKMDTFLLSLMKPATDVGIYSAAYKVFEGLLFFPAAFAGLMLPLMSSVANSKQEQFKIFFKRALDFLVIATFPIMVGGFVLSQKIVFLIGGAEFLIASLPLKILMVALFFVFLGNLFGNAVIALDKQKKMVYVYGVGVFISVVFNLIFIPQYSYLATSVVTLVTEIAVNSIMFFIILKEIKYWPLDGRFLKASAASLIMGVLMYFNLDQNIFILVFLGVIVYSVTLFFLKGISKEEIKFIIFKQPVSATPLPSVGGNL